MTLTNRQSELDVEKWLKSEKAGRDLCGDFELRKNEKIRAEKTYDTEKQKSISAQYLRRFLRRCRLCAYKPLTACKNRNCSAVIDT